MTNHELLDMIGDANGIYLLQAQTHRDETPLSEPKTFPLRRLWLIAAILAMALLLVGCTVVYVLSLQDMKVGEYTYTEPAHISGTAEPVEKTTTLVSLQGIYQPALEEWLAFQDSYDPDKSLLIANNHNESEVPEPYYTTYGCYTWEMVDKLDEIIRKYDLKLLEPYIMVQSEESDILFDALELENFHLEDAEAEVEYAAGYFYPEGTFDISAYVTLPDPNWSYKNLLSIRYSLKEYFDPVSGSLGDINSYTQWSYTTKDGTSVLLAMNEDHARIYADLTDAFVSIRTNAYGYEGREQVPMTKETLQQLADIFDYHIKPQYADLELVNQRMEEVAAQRQAEKDAIQAQQEELMAGGFENYAQYRLSTWTGTGELCYSLYDLNGDGREEFIVRDSEGVCYEVLSQHPSVNGGQTYLYYDPSNISSTAAIYPCSENQFVLRSESNTFLRNAFFEAGEYGVYYIEGVNYSKQEEKWYYLPDDDPWTDNDEVIPQARAQNILDKYPLDSLGDPIPMTEFAAPAVSLSSPYDAIIAERLETDPDSRYTLYDINSDGVEELLLESSLFVQGEPAGTCFGIYSQMNGELVDLNTFIVNHICEGGYLEESYTDADGAISHSYYELKILGVKIVETIEYDPATGHWTRDTDGPWGEEPQVISEAEAKSILVGYQRIEPDWKPLTEYPRN